MTADGVLTSYKVPYMGHLVSHMLYVDDVLIFTNSSKNNLKKLMHFLKDYANQSGHAFNAEKSDFFRT